METKRPDACAESPVKNPFLYESSNQGGQQTLRAECQSAEHWQSCGHTPDILSVKIGQDGDQHDSQCFHGGAWTSDNKDFVALTSPQWVVSQTVDIAVNRLGTVQQYIENVTQATIRSMASYMAISSTFERPNTSKSSKLP